MGNEIEQDENDIMNINNDEIIENDCYEDIDIDKINKLIEKEKSWNANTIIYQNNDIINIRSDEKENKNERSKDFNNEINNDISIKDNEAQEEKKNDKENIDNNNNQKAHKNRLKSNVMPKIRPQNTSDEVLNKSSRADKNKKDLKKKEQNNNIKQKEIQANENFENENEHQLDINNIIPEFRLITKKENDIIYSGVLEKILKVPMNANKIVYSERFCIITKNYFAYYKSKESFISSNKPICKIDNKDIIGIENERTKHKGCYIGIICEINENTKNLIYKVNSFQTNLQNSSQLLLGFRAKSYDDMVKWVTTLNYCVSEKKQNV